MSSPTEPVWQEGDERLLQRLRERYEALGYAFKIAPSRMDLPEFLGAYLPDAIATKQGHNVAIEVKSRQSLSSDPTLSKIRSLFEDHPEWHFSVFYAGGEPLQSIKIPTASASAVSYHLNEAVDLNLSGQSRIAFVVAWSLLEAVSHAIDGQFRGKPRTPGTVVQSLATNGLIEPETEERLRSLIPLRNAIVHGDLTIELSGDDVDFVLSVVKGLIPAIS